ncbi:uncharacterized protein LOC115950091 [Quercus lobata]|uniref:uncharacterized protein LOC115950091 n=1 Tax=Quercus lobata TaxID=97700 RepID=UPI0012465401|nr:uncharacterized protein LOC115950091 [Quercus lobata]
MKPPILVPPVPEKPLLGALLAQYLEETGKENTIYYISKKMLPYEEKYSPLEKTCVALVWATHKLKHYMLAYKILLIARIDHLKYLMEKLVQDGKTAKWVLLLSEFDNENVTQKFVKGRAIADHLAPYSLEEAEKIQGDFPDEDIMGIEVESWKMYFDKATNQNGNGIGILLISPKGTHIPFSGKLNFPATNNTTEYEACIMGLQVALGLGVKELEVYGDSALISSQIQNKWKIKEERLMLYHECLQKWASKFNRIRYRYVPWMQNQIANALATMASMMDGPKKDETRPKVVEQKEEPTYYTTIEEDEGKNGEGEWYSDILQYLKDGTYPKFADKNDQLTIWKLSTNYNICGERIYRRSYNGIHLLCVTTKEA